MTEEPRPPVRRYCHALAPLAGGLLAVSLATFVLIPTHRGFAYVVLVGVVFAIGRWLGRDAGVVAAAAAGLAWMGAFGDPRFQHEIGNDAVVRFGLVLVLAGLVAAALGARASDRARANRSRRTDDRTRPSSAA